MKRIISFRYLLSFVVMVMLLAMGSPAQAQYDIGYTHYMFNEFFINPAYAGAKDAFAATVMTRDQWSGFKGAPRTIMINAHMPVAKDQVGLGVGVTYEQIGVSQQTAGYFDFAYRVHFSKSVLAFGLQGSVGYQNVNYGDLQNLTDKYTVDPLLMAAIPKLITNVGFGTYYYTKNFHIGLSIPRFLNNLYISGENKRFDITDWTYYLQSGYVFHFGDDFQIMPSAMLKLTYGVQPQLNISTVSLLWNTLWLGADYRTDNTLAAMVGFQLSRYFRLTYSYDMNLSNDTRRALGGSHEITLSYTLNFVHKRMVSPRLF